MRCILGQIRGYLLEMFASKYIWNGGSYMVVIWYEYRVYIEAK